MVFGGAAAAMAVTVLSGDKVWAEDYCVTPYSAALIEIYNQSNAQHLKPEQVESLRQRYLQELERGVREKCKNGDLIIAIGAQFNSWSISDTEVFMRLCDLHQPVVHVGFDEGIYTKNSFACFLAPPRRIY